MRINFEAALEIHFKLPAHRSSQAVKELPDLQTAGVVLNVARIKVVRDVENDHTCAHTLIEEWNSEAFEDRCIEREECRKASTVARADEIEPLVNERERKTRANLQCRHHRDAEGRLHFTVGQETMRYVERQHSKLVWPNHKSRKVAEEIIRCVQ